MSDDTLVPNSSDVRDTDEQEREGGLSPGREGHRLDISNKTLELVGPDVRRGPGPTPTTAVRFRFNSSLSSLPREGVQGSCLGW